jgi:hypothetical protein
MQQEMKKIAIFTEGQSEQIFLRHLLLQTMDCSKISFSCLRLRKGKMIHVPFDYPNPNAEAWFLIVNVGQDEKVLSVIKESEKDLFKKGFERIVGLRDMYSEEYSKRSPNGIDDSVTRAFIDGWNSTIKSMSNPSKIKMHIAIMELEAWFLGMYNIFKRLDPALSIDYIEKEFGYNLSGIDPQTVFFKPSDIFSDILQLINWQYKKSEHEMEHICSKINMNDLSDAFENGRCINFKNFYDEILKFDY